MSKNLFVVVPDEAKTSIQRFVDKAVAFEEAGSIATKDDWEDARSDAVDGLIGILRANPHYFEYAHRMADIAARRKANAK